MTSNSRGPTCQGVQGKNHIQATASQIWERHRTLYGSDHTDVGKEEAWVDPLTVVVAGNCCICRVAQRESERRQPVVGGGGGGGYAEEVRRPVECTAGGEGGRDQAAEATTHHHCQPTTTRSCVTGLTLGPVNLLHEYLSCKMTSWGQSNSKPRKLM